VKKSRASRRTSAWKRRSSAGRPRPPVRVRPAPSDQLTVPAEQRCRAHRRACPGAPRQRAPERSEHRSIDRPEPRSPRLPAQNCQLMSQQEELQFLRPLRFAQQHGQLNQPAERQTNDQTTQTSGIRERRSYRCPCEAAPRPRTGFLNRTPHRALGLTAPIPGPRLHLVDSNPPDQLHRRDRLGFAYPTGLVAGPCEDDYSRLDRALTVPGSSDLWVAHRRSERGTKPCSRGTAVLPYAKSWVFARARVNSL
jgi:hypothetical protein